MFHYLNLQYLFYRIYTLLIDTSAPGGNPSVGGITVSPEVAQFLVLLTILAVFLAILFLCAALYAAIRLEEIMKRTKFRLPEVSVDANRPPKKEEWDQVIKHVSSENPSDWKLAVLEADGMLDELTLALQIPGDTLGERLKNANFKSIDDAWEAHKTRNQVAHEGLSFMLTKREARVAVERFGNVLREFKLI